MVECAPATGLRRGDDGGSPLISCVNSTFTLVPAPSVLGVLFGGVMLTGRRRW